MNPKSINKNQKVVDTIYKEFKTMVNNIKEIENKNIIDETLNKHLEDI